MHLLNVTEFRRLRSGKKCMQIFVRIFISYPQHLNNKTKCFLKWPIMEPSLIWFDQSNYSIKYSVKSNTLWGTRYIILGLNVTTKILFLAMHLKSLNYDSLGKFMIHTLSVLFIISIVFIKAFFMRCYGNGAIIKKDNFFLLISASIIIYSCFVLFVCV